MSKTAAFEDDILQHVFQNAAIANIGDASGLPAAATAGQLHIALFSSDPGEAGGGTEATYTGYGRVGVDRNGTEWSVSAGVASNINTITFGTASTTNAGGDISHFAIMTAGTGGDMLYYGALGTARTVSNGVTLEFAGGALTVTED